MELEKILTEMEDLIYNSSRLLWSGKIIMDADELGRIMDSLREAIPKEVQRANTLLEDQKNIRDAARSEAESIIAQASAEAEELLEQAKEKAEKMISEEEIVNQANENAQQVIEDAEEYAKKVREGAQEYSEQLKYDSQKYAEEAFDYLEESVSNTLATIRQQRASFVDDETEEKNEEE